MTDYENHCEVNAPGLIGDVKEVIGRELGVDFADIADIDSRVATIIAYTLKNAQLVNGVGVARLLGVSRQRVHQLKDSATTPPPITTTTTIREGDQVVELWLREEIEAFNDVREPYGTRLQRVHPLLREDAQE